MEYKITPHFVDSECRIDIGIEGPPYTSLNSAEKQTRLTRLHPGPKSHDGTNFTLFTTNLNSTSMSTHKALAYVWADTECHINIPGSEIKYTLSELGNMFLALCSLRDEVQDVIIWIDAICIDQSNDNEKSEQVRMMGLIYQSAEEVIGWLGGHVKASELNLIEEWSKFGQEEVEDTEILYGLAAKKTIPAFMEIEALNQAGPIAFRPYWGRAWIFQEVTLASSIRFTCNEGATSLESLETALATWRNVSDSLDINAELNRRLPGRGDHWGKVDQQQYETLRILAHSRSNMSNMLRLSSDFKELLSRQSLIPLERLRLEHVLEFSQLKATDPRDKTFALWTFIDPDGPRASLLMPDYSATVEGIFIRAAIYLILTEGSLSLLECTSWSGNTTLDLPTWVPDWSQLNVIFRLHAKKEYSSLASNPVSTMLKISEESRVLEVKGQKLAVVADGLGGIIFPFGVSEATDESIYQKSLHNLEELVLAGPSTGQRTSLEQFLQILNVTGISTKEERQQT